MPKELKAIAHLKNFLRLILHPKFGRGRIMPENLKLLLFEDRELVKV